MTAINCSIVKREGAQEPFSKAKLLQLLKRLSNGLNMSFIDLEQEVDKIEMSLSDQISITQLFEFVAEHLATKTIYHPDFSTLAGRVEAVKIQGLSKKSFSENTIMLYRNSRNGEPGKPMISKKVYDTVLKHKQVLDNAVVEERDYEISYFGIKTLERSYLINIEGVVSETLQYLLMRVALGIHFDDIEKVIETYELMSQKYFIHASPTLFNAGTDYNFLSSCFLVANDDDSIDGIYKTLHKSAMISKASGGIGLHFHDVRSNGSVIKSTNGRSNGLIPMLRVFNDTARYVDQGGNKRPGAFAIYLEPWHGDIFEVLELKKNYGKEEMRARDLFYGLWIPDLFMERVKKDELWSLFSSDSCPGLSDCHGDEFKALYSKYESEGKAIATVKAQKLWKVILENQTETGGPYILYKDACNKKSNQQNLGTIKSSNLCCEIVEYSSKDETAVCNLGSLALPSFLKEGSEFIEFDFEKLHSVTKVLGRNLDKIIDVTRYPVESARTSNTRHRPIAIGVQGLADTFLLLRLPFESEEAKRLNIQIFETIYHAAIESSIELAKEKGKYETFKGSPASYGQLQFDLWDHKPSDLYQDWDVLKEKVKEFGLRNSLLVAPMPTASTSQILGFNECFEPLTSNIYSRRVISGEFQVVNKFLINDLIELGLWDKEMKDQILLNEGSIQNIQEIPTDLKQLYKTVWEISQKHIIDMAADRGKFIDQLQSMNIYMKDPTFGKLTSCHFYSWSKGLKTGMYYLRTQAASKAIQFTVENTPVESARKTSPPLTLERKRYMETTGSIRSKKIKLQSEDPPIENEDVSIYDDRVRFCKLDSKDCESCSG